MKLTAKVQGESWRDFAAVVYGVWMAVWLYATLHDLYLIRIAPEHFTEYHYKIPFTENLTLLAILYALGASISPGLLLGTVLYFVGRFGSRPKLNPGSIIFSTVWVCLAVECCAVATGLMAWHLGRGIYPEWVYPDETPGIAITQTIQVTAYLSGMVLSLALIVWTWRRRRKLAAEG